MDRLQGCAELRCDLHRLFWGDGTVRGESIGQSDALEELHGEEGGAGAASPGRRHVELVDATDIRTIDLAGQLHFLFEAGEDGRILRDRGTDGL